MKPHFFLLDSTNTARLHQIVKEVSRRFTPILRSSHYEDAKHSTDQLQPRTTLQVTWSYSFARAAKENERSYKKWRGTQEARRAGV